MKRFEELLDDFENSVRACESYFAGQTVGDRKRDADVRVAARRALVEYVRERMELPADLVARIERQILRFEREHDLKLSFGEAVRTLLDVALTGEEERDTDDELDECKACIHECCIGCDNNPNEEDFLNELDD